MSKKSTNVIWTRLAGYALVQVITQPDQVALILRQPAGKTPYRIRLQKPKSLEIPRDLPTEGIRITMVEMSALDSGDESVAIELADGQVLKGMCQQIIVDVF